MIGKEQCGGTRSPGQPVTRILPLSHTEAHRITPNLSDDNFPFNRTYSCVWHLNVHYSPFFNGVGGFSPVLLSAGGAWVGACETALPRRRARSRDRGHSGGRALGRRWAGRAQGGGGGGGPFFSRIPPWHAYLARFSRVRGDANRTRRAQSGADDTDALRELAGTKNLAMLQVENPTVEWMLIFFILRPP
eukprot:gene9512-biopygen7692